MATSYIYNGLRTNTFRDGVEGVELPYAGQSFWIPYKGVLPVPNWALREVDHDKSTPQRGEMGVVRYKNELVDGKRLAEELTLTQIPTPNRDKGIQIIEGRKDSAGRFVGEMTTMCAGYAQETGEPMMVDVQLREPSKPEIERAEQAADRYMRQMIAEYFDSKRSRMTGGQGKNTADPTTRFYMELLNVEDIDDVTTHQKSLGGMTPEMLKVVLEENRRATEVNGAALARAVETVRKTGKAQLSNSKHGRRPQGLAEKKKQYDLEHAEDKLPELTVSE